MILKELIFTVFKKITWINHCNSGVLSELWQFNQKNAGANVAMRAKLTVTKNFGVKTGTE